jgi:hypothetical protein
LERPAKACDQPVEAIVANLGLAPQVIEQLPPRQNMPLTIDELKEQLHDQRFDGNLAAGTANPTTRRIDGKSRYAKRKRRCCVHLPLSL